MNLKNSFKQYISSSKGRLDIAIQSGETYLSSDARKEEFLTSNLTVEHKPQGVKITLLKKDNTGIAENDWIVANEGTIIYPNEHLYESKTSIRKNSINNSQFILVWEQLRKLRKVNIPLGTELFVEFLDRTTTYTEKHKMVLMGYTNSSYEEKQGKLITNPNLLETDLRETYAKELNIDCPQVLFEGILDQNSFANGIKNKDLKDSYRKSNIWDKENIIENITSMMLDIDSKYGGPENGIVIKYNESIIKFINKKPDNSILESVKYKTEISKLSDLISEDIQKVIKKDKIQDISEVLTILSDRLKDMKIDSSIGKSRVEILEDIQKRSRESLAKIMPGNNGILLVTKMKILTTEHWQIIKDAMIKYDTVTVALLSSTDTRGTKKLRNLILEASFPDLEVINSSSSNIKYLTEKSLNSINKVQMIENDIDIISNIEDFKYFKENVPKIVIPFYDEYLKVYK